MRRRDKPSIGSFSALPDDAWIAAGSYQDLRDRPWSTRLTTVRRGDRSAVADRAGRAGPAGVFDGLHPA